MTNDAKGRKAIVAQCRNGLCAGAYTIEARKLRLNSEFGSQSTMLGLQKPEKLACRMLKHVCDINSSGSDDPRLLKTRPRIRRQASVEPAAGPLAGPPMLLDGPPTLADERVSA